MPTRRNHKATPELHAFARRLVEARNTAGLSQRELARRFEHVDHFGRRQTIQNAYISQLEHGKRYPTIDAVFALANAAGVEPYWLLTGSP